MNTMELTVVTSAPAGEFHEVTIHLPEWQTRFLKLLQEGKNIRYNIFLMPSIPAHIQDELIKRGYCHVILESDRWRHYLIHHNAAS